MAKPKLSIFLSVFFALVLAEHIIQGSGIEVVFPNEHAFGTSGQHKESNFQVGDEERIMSSRRLMIGSTAPICSYNECRRCKYKCRAEQVPVEGNDPINSPYRYRCVCRR